MIFWDLGIGQGYFKNGLMALWFKWFAKLNWRKSKAV